MLRATPRSRWMSSKRRMPWNTSLMMSSVQRSPITSNEEAMGQYWVG